MDEVVTLIREGKVDQAEQRLQQHPAGQGGDAQWHYAQGRLLDAKGQPEEALDAYRSALDLDENHTESAFRLAFGLDLRGEDEQAMRVYESLVRRVPAPVNAMLNLAVLYEDHGKYRPAMACVRRVLMENPNHARARLFARDIESSMHMFYDEDHERGRQKRDAVLDTPIADFELSVRSRNCLRKMDIHTLGDLLRTTEPELLSYKNFGDTSLTEIKLMLTQKGLRLGQLREEEPWQSGDAGEDSPYPEPVGSPDILSRPLSEIEFSSRARKCLQRLGLRTVGDLISKSETELLAIKNFGQTSLNEVRQKLDEFGLVLRKTS
jgi:DNA-directed RNA polymerase subunit alpha